MTVVVVPHAANVPTALEIDGKEHIRPVTWDEWITLPVRDGDHAVRTPRGAIRLPTVIVAVNQNGIICFVVAFAMFSTTKLRKPSTRKLQDNFHTIWKKTHSTLD